jgi:hypothetical protein
MRYTLLGEDLWTYISEGTNPFNLVEFGTVIPKAINSKSSSEDVSNARTFVINDAKANAVMCHHLAPLIFHPSMIIQLERPGST